MEWVVNLFHDYMGELYGSEVRWSDLEETPVVEMVRRYFDDVLRRAEECVTSDPEQLDALERFVDQVMNYVPVDSPKWWFPAVLDSRGRRGREFVLRRERHRLAHSLARLVPSGGVSSRGGLQMLPTFRDLLGEVNLSRTLEALDEIGVRPGKQHAPLIAAMEVALEKFNGNAPANEHWPYMLREQFGVTASSKAVPQPVRSRTEKYKTARQSMLDALKS